MLYPQPNTKLCRLDYSYFIASTIICVKKISQAIAFKGTPSSNKAHRSTFCARRAPPVMLHFAAQRRPIKQRCETPEEGELRLDPTRPVRGVVLILAGSPVRKPQSAWTFLEQEPPHGGGTFASR